MMMVCSGRGVHPPQILSLSLSLSVLLRVTYVHYNDFQLANNVTNGFRSPFLRVQYKKQIVSA